MLFFSVIPLKSFDEESNTSASLVQDEIQDTLLQDIREPTIAQLLQEKTLYSSAEWPKVSWNRVTSFNTIPGGHISDTLQTVKLLNRGPMPTQVNGNILGIT